MKEFWKIINEKQLSSCGPELASNEKTRNPSNASPKLTC